eukprot:scaffold34702_cov101-Isochrysis_galbana.AAC.1
MRGSLRAFAAGAARAEGRGRGVVLCRLDVAMWRGVPRGRAQLRGQPPTPASGLLLPASFSYAALPALTPDSRDGRRGTGNARAAVGRLPLLSLPDRSPGFASATLTPPEPLSLPTLSGKCVMERDASDISLT